MYILPKSSTKLQVLDRCGNFGSFTHALEELMEEAYEKYLTKKEGTTKQRTDEEKARGRWC